MSDYNIRSAFERIENELIASMIRNMKRHREWEDDEGFNWEQWQALQLKNLEEYKRRNQKIFGKKFREINEQLELAILKAREDGNMAQELELLEMVKSGKFKKPRMSKKRAETNAEFFKMNDRKMQALIDATVSDMEKAETAILRMANDKYRKIIFDAQVYANSGAGTYEKAVDMVTRDFLAAGLNCVEYKNGARHTLKDYADMALRTASKRAYLTGEGEKRKEWGIATVIMNKRGNPCPLCLPFVGKVMIDDVWSGGSSKDGDYPLMSDAISKGLYHPRCRDSHTTYFEGISTPPDDVFTKKEIEEIEEVNKAEAKKQYAQRQVEKFRRLAKYSLDGGNRRIYQQRRRNWQYAASDITGRTVPVNGDATFKVKIPGYDDNVNASISDSCKYVVYQGDRERKEVLHLLDLVTGDIAYTEIGEPGSVGGKEFWDFLHSHDGRFAFIHNHPDGDSLSDEDVNTLLASKIEVMIGAGHNGKVYVGVVKDEIDLNLYNERTIIRKETTAALLEAKRMYEEGEIFYPEYNRIIIRETNKRLVEKFGEFYELET